MGCRERSKRRNGEGHKHRASDRGRKRQTELEGGRVRRKVEVPGGRNAGMEGRARGEGSPVGWTRLPRAQAGLWGAKQLCRTEALGPKANPGLRCSRPCWPPEPCLQPGSASEGVEPLLSECHVPGWGRWRWVWGPGFYFSPAGRSCPQSSLSHRQHHVLAGPCAAPRGAVAQIQVPSGPAWGDGASEDGVRADGQEGTGSWARAAAG